MALKKLWLAAALLLGACQPAVTAEPPVPATATAVPLLLLGVDEAAARLPELIDYQPAQAQLQWIAAGSVTLFDDLNSGQIDAALTHVIPAEQQALWFNPVAVDGVAVIVHPDNPIETLSLAELAAIFSGRIANWQTVNGADQPISLIARERSSTAGQLLQERVLTTNRLSINAQIAADAQSVVDAVAADSGAIGVIMHGALPDAAFVRLLQIDGIALNSANLAAQRYPLSVPIYWVSVQEPQGALRRLLGYLQSYEGQTRLEAQFGRVR